ncbi:O-antigen ligase family protein [Actinocorallia longicatena]|uniref:O-antigen ligase-related domain-containing protein n=1 Tax=Actinocorallia longicatena TaxID=111803 RepID=A0ABP6QCX8_9ACTN
MNPALPSSRWRNHSSDLLVVSLWRAARECGRAVLRRPIWAIAAVVLSACVPAGRENLEASFHVSPADVSSVAAVVVVGWAGVRHGRRMRPGPAVFLSLLVAWAGCVTLASEDIATSLPGYIRFVQIFIAIPAAVIVAIEDRRDVAILCGALGLASFLEAALGIWQTLSRNGASYAGEPVRAVGTFGALDVMGMATVVGIGFIVTLCSFFSARGRRRAALLAVIVVQIGALVCSLSRGSWISVAAATVLVCLVCFGYRALRIMIVGGALLVVCALPAADGTGLIATRLQSITDLTSSPDQSVSDRYNLWSTAYRIWVDHPITGTGPKQFAAFRDAYAPLDLSAASDTEDAVNGFVREPLLSPHNQYLLILCEQGIVGASIFAALIVTLLARLRRRLGSAGKMPGVIAAGLLTWLLVNFVYSDLGGPTSVLLATVLGLSAAIASRADERRTPEHDAAPPAGPRPTPSLPASPCHGATR